MRCGVVRLVTRKSPCDVKIRRKGWSSLVKHCDSSALCDVAESKLIGRCCAHKICRVVDKSSKVLCNTLSTSNGSKKKTVFNKSPLINRLDHLNNLNSDFVWTDYNLYNEKLDNSINYNSVPKLPSSQHSRTSKIFRNKKKCVFYSSENPIRSCHTRFKLPHSSSRYHTLRKSESVSHRSSCDLPPCRSYLDRFEAVKRKRLYPIAKPSVRHLQNSDFHNFIDNEETDTGGDCTSGLINPNIINHLNETSYMSLCGCDTCDKKFKACERKSRINKFLNRKLSKILNFYRQKNLKTKLYFQERCKYETDLNKIYKRVSESTEKHSRPIYEPSIDQKRCGRYRQITEFRDNYKSIRRRCSKNKFNHVRYPNFDEKSKTFNSRDKINANNTGSEVNIGSKIYNGLKTCGEFLSFGMASNSGKTESKAIQTNTYYLDQPLINNQLLKNNVYDLTRKYCYDGSNEDNVGDQFIPSVEVSFKYPDIKHLKPDTPCDNSVRCSLSEEFKSRHNLSNSSHGHTDAVYNTENEKCYELLSNNIASSYNSMFDCNLATTSNYSKSYENSGPYGSSENTKPFSEGSAHKLNTYFNKEDELNANSSCYFDDCKNDLNHNTIDGCNSVPLSQTNRKVQPSAQSCVRDETNFKEDNSTKISNDVSLKSFDSQNTGYQTQFGPIDSINDFIANNDARYKEKEDLVKIRSNFSIFPRSAWKDTLLLPESDLLSEPVDVSKPYFYSGFTVKKDESKNLSRYSEINIAIQKVRKKIENIIYDSNETKSIFENEWSDNFDNLYSETLINTYPHNDYNKNNEQKTFSSQNNVEYNNATNNCNKQEGRNTVNSNSSKFEIDHDSDLMDTNVTNHQLKEAEHEGENLQSVDQEDNFDDCKCIYRNYQHIASSVHLNEKIKNIKESNRKENVVKDDTRSEFIEIAPHFTGYRVYDQHQSSNQVRKVRFKDSGLTCKPGTERLLVMGRDTLFNQTCNRSMSTSCGENIYPIDIEKINKNNKLFKEDHQDGSIYQDDNEKSLNVNQKTNVKQKSFVAYVGGDTNKIDGECIEEQITTGLSGSVNSSHTFSKVEYTSYQEGRQNELYNKSIQTFAKTNKAKSEFNRTEYDLTEKSSAVRNLSCDGSYFERACHESRNLKSHVSNGKKISDKCDENIYPVESKIMSHTNERTNKTISSTQDIKDPVRESVGLKSSWSESAFTEKEYEPDSSNSSKRNFKNVATEHSGCINVGYLGLKFTSFSFEKWNEGESSDLNETEKFEKDAPKGKINNTSSSNSPMLRNSKLLLKESRTLGMRNKNEMTSDALNIRNPFSVDSGALRPVSSTCTLSKDDKTAIIERLRNIRKIEKVDYALEERRIANNTPIDTVKVKETYSSPDTSISNQESHSPSDLKICSKEYIRRVKNKPTGDSEDTRQITEEMKVVGLFPEGKGTIKGRVMTVIARQRSKFTAVKSHEDSIESTLENCSVTGEVSDSKILKPIVDSRPIQKGFVKAILSSPKLPEFNRDRKKIHNDQESTLIEERTNEQDVNKIQKQKTYKKYEGTTERDDYLVEMKKVKPNKLENKESVSPITNLSLKKQALKKKIFEKVDSYRYKNEVNREDETPDQISSERKHTIHTDNIDKNERDRNSVTLINSEDEKKSPKVDAGNEHRMSSEYQKNKTVAKETHMGLDNSKEDKKKIDDFRESRMLTNTGKKKNVREKNTSLADKFIVTMGTIADSKIQEPKYKEGNKNISAEFDLNNQESSSNFTNTKKTSDHNKTEKSIKYPSKNEAISSTEKALDIDNSKKEIKSEPEEFGKKSSLQDFEEYKESWLNGEKDVTKDLNKETENNKKSRLLQLGRKFGNSTTKNQDESKISTFQTRFDKIIAEHRSKLKNAEKPEKSDYTSITNYLESNKTDALEEKTDSSDQPDNSISATPMADNKLVITHFKQMHRPKYDKLKPLKSDKKNFEFEASMLKVTYEGKSEANGESFDTLSDDVEKELNEIVSPYMEEFKSTDSTLVSKEKESDNDKIKPKEYYLSLLENKSFLSSRQRVVSTEDSLEKDGLRVEQDKTVKSFTKNRLKFTEAIPAKYKSYVDKSKELLLGANVSTLITTSFKKPLEKHQEDQDKNYKKELNPDLPEESTALKPQTDNSNEEEKKDIKLNSFVKQSLEKVRSKSLTFGNIESVLKRSKTDEQYNKDNEIREDVKDESIQSSSQNNDKQILKSVKNLAKFDEYKETMKGFDKIKKTVTDVKDRFTSRNDKSRKSETVRQSLKEEIVTETPKLEVKGEIPKITKIKTRYTNPTHTMVSSRINEQTSLVTDKSTKKTTLVPDIKIDNQNVFGNDKELKWDDKLDFYEEVTTVKQMIGASLKHEDSLKTSDNYLEKQHKTEIKTHMKSEKVEVTDESTEQNVLGSDEGLRWDDKSDFHEEVTTVKETIDASLQHGDSLKTSDNYLVKQHKTEIETHKKSKKHEGVDSSKNIALKDTGIVNLEETKIKGQKLEIDKSPKTIEIESGPLRIANETTDKISRIEKSSAVLEIEETNIPPKSIDKQLDGEVQAIIKPGESFGPTPKQIIKEQDEKTSTALEEEKPTSALDQLPDVKVEKSKLLQVVEMKPQEDKEMKAWEKEPTYIKNLRPGFYEKKKIEKITNNYYQNELKFQTLMVKNKMVSVNKTSDCKNVDCKKEQAPWVADMCCSLDKKDKPANDKNKKSDVLKDTPKNRSPDRVPHFRSGRGSRMAEWPDSLSRRREPIIKDPFSPRPRWRP